MLNNNLIKLSKNELMPGCYCHKARDISRVLKENKFPNLINLPRLLQFLKSP